MFGAWIYLVSATVTMDSFEVAVYVFPSTVLVTIQ